jgi:hypothetical protein
MHGQKVQQNSQIHIRTIRKRYNIQRKFRRIVNKINQFLQDNTIRTLNRHNLLKVRIMKVAKKIINLCNH